MNDLNIITLKDHPLAVIINDLLNETNNQELFITLKNIRTLLNISLKIIPADSLQSLKDYQLLVNYVKTGKKLSASYDQGSFPDLFKIYNSEASSKLLTVECAFVIFLCHMIDSIKDVKDFCINKEGLYLLFRNPIHFYNSIFPDKQTYFNEEVFKYDVSDNYKNEVKQWVDTYLEWFLINNKIINTPSDKISFKQLIFYKIFELQEANIKPSYSSEDAKEVFDAFTLLIKANWPNELHKIKIACNLSEKEYADIMSWYRYNSSIKKFNETSPEVLKDYEFSDDISDIEDFLKKETSVSTAQMTVQKIILSPETRNLVEDNINLQKPSRNHSMTTLPQIIKPINDTIPSDEEFNRYYEDKTQVEVHYYNLKKSKDLLIATGIIDKINKMGIMLKLENDSSLVIYKSDIKQIIPAEDLKVIIFKLEKRLMKLEEIVNEFMKTQK